MFRFYRIFRDLTEVQFLRTDIVHVEALELEVKVGAALIREIRPKTPLVEGNRNSSRISGEVSLSVLLNRNRLKSMTKEGAIIKAKSVLSGNFDRTQRLNS